MSGQILLWGAGKGDRAYRSRILEMAGDNGLRIEDIAAKEFPPDIDISGFRRHDPADVCSGGFDYVIVTAFSKYVPILDEALKRGFREDQIVSVDCLMLSDWNWPAAIKMSADRNAQIRKNTPLLFYREPSPIDETMFPPEFSYGKDMNVCQYNFEQGTDIIDDNITIFSPNCAAGLLYHSLRMKFRSPIINMYLSFEDYIKFCMNPHKYIDAKIEFHHWEEDSKKKGRAFPAFSLLDIRLNMNHYDNISFAIDKWEERKERINWGKIFVVGICSTVEQLLLFERLPYRHKIVFTPFAWESDHVIPVDESLYPGYNVESITNGIAGGGILGYRQKLLHSLQETNSGFIENLLIG